MTNQELLTDLTFRSTRLEVSVALLKADLADLKMRFEAPEAATPFSPFAKTMPAALPKREVAPTLPPLPTIPKIPPPIAIAGPAPTVVAPEEIPAKPAGPGFELQFGKWLARIGVVFALFTLIFFSVLVHHTLYQYLGPWSKLSVLTLVSTGLIAAGLRLEKRDSKLLVYGRTLAGGGLACLYYTIYGATYVPQLHVIGSPLFGGMLLLAWSAGVLWLAEKRRSELLSVFALSLAYFSSAITPETGFIMAADLILAATAVIFLARNAWAGLSYLCLIGTYVGFLRQAVVYRGPLDFDWTGTLPFWPSAVYLTGAWLIFTAGILLTRAPNFVAGKRMAFLCLNNGAWVGLLVVAARLGSFDHIGGIFGAVGAAFLISCALFRLTHSDARDIAGAYLAQGLAFATGGLAIATSGVTRGLMLTIESVFLVSAGAYSRNLILRIGGAATALLGAGFLADEIVTGHPNYPWVLTFGGALAMLANAWLARRELWHEPREVAAARWKPASVLHVLLALAIIVTGIVCHAPFRWIAPDLALVSLLLALSVYVLPLFELTPLSQILLILAQAFSFGLGWESSDTDNWFSQPQWSHNLVALVTMLMATWWPRQTRVRTKGWLQPLTVIYALAMVAFCYQSAEPHQSPQAWMIDSALFSLVFLAYGAWSRLWSFALLGQILLAMSVGTFLTYRTFFPWTWWAAAIPIAVVFATGWIAREVFSQSANMSATTRDTLRLAARVYQSIAVGLLVRWVFGVAPGSEITLWLIALGTAFLGSGLSLRSSYAIRTALVLGVVGVGHYYVSWPGVPYQSFTWMDAAAMALLLAQPALLRHWGRELISTAESWALIAVSSVAGWSFVSNAVVNSREQNLTLAWALYAVALIITGFAANERRQRWCGLGILAAAFVRVGVHDVWGWSDLYKVLTFLVLTVICLGLSFLYYKFADRLKEWL